MESSPGLNIFAGGVRGPEIDIVVPWCRRHLRVEFKPGGLTRANVGGTRRNHPLAVDPSLAGSGIDSTVNPLTINITGTQFYILRIADTAGILPVIRPPVGISHLQHMDGIDINGHQAVRITPVKLTGIALGQ
jgi:hypothetical protein